jgi:hypothetical protein
VRAQPGAFSLTGCAGEPKMNGTAGAEFLHHFPRGKWPRLRAGHNVLAAPTEAQVTGGEASDKACPWRVVLRRALVALGYLVFSWRQIPLQVRLQKTAKIT